MPSNIERSTLHASRVPFVDLALARRLERAEAMANAAFVDARRALQPQVGAEWIDVAGVFAMFDGSASPLTQTFGLGVFDPFLDPEFERVEAFFAMHGAPTSHEVSSFVAAETLARLGVRGYSPIEASVVLVRPTFHAAVPEPAIVVRPIESAEAPLWCRIAGEGWSSESAEAASFVEGLSAVVAQARGVTCFLAELDRAPIATGALHLTNGIALLAGASTIPSARRRGAQLALLHARLAFAAAQGGDLAMVVTQPGSASQRNAERQGFRPLYTRTKWQRTLRHDGIAADAHGA